jgi:hypothetical protein
MDNNNHSAAESKGPVARTAHEYIRNIVPFRYQECSSCGNRTDLACIRCGYCYSCHWKKEKEDGSLLENKTAEIFPPPMYHAIKKVPMENVLEQQPLQEGRQKRLIIDVHGRTSEPICRYHGCGHKFSAHGLGNCKCKHPTNKTLGVFTKYP